MKKFILPLISLVMTCCDGCNSKNDVSVRSQNLLNCLENYLKDSNTEDENKKILKDVIPALLMLKKIIYADEKLKPEQTQNSLLQSVTKLVQNGGKEEIETFLAEIKKNDKKKSMALFENLYLELYKILSKKNIFRTIENDKIVKKEKDTPIIFKFSNDEVENLKKKILDRKKSGDNTDENSEKKQITIAELLNEDLREKKLSLSENATYIVIQFESFGDIKFSSDFNPFERSLRGESILKYVCAFSDEGYNEKNFIFDEENAPCDIKFLNFSKLQKEEKKVPAMFLFKINKVSNKNLSNFLDEK